MDMSHVTWGDVEEIAAETGLGGWSSCAVRCAKGMQTDYGLRLGLSNNTNILGTLC